MIGTVLHFLLGVTVVGGLLWAASHLAKRATGGGLRAGRDEPLKVVARRQVAKGANVVRVSVEDRDLLLGASQKGVELLCELPKTEAPSRATAPAPGPVFTPAGPQSQPTFAEALSRSLTLRRRRY